MRDNQERSRKESLKKQQEVTSKLIEALKEKGYEWSNCSINGIYFPIEVSSDRTGYGWGKVYTGKVRIKVGNWGEIKQFPEPKAGFDISKIVSYIIEQVKLEEKKIAKERELSQKKEKAQQVANTINRSIPGTAFGLNAIVDKHGYLSLDIRVRCSEEQAEKILRYAAGILHEEG